MTLIGLALPNYNEPTENDYAKIAKILPQVIQTMFGHTRHRRPVYDRIRDIYMAAGYPAPIITIRIGDGVQDIEGAEKDFLEAEQQIPGYFKERVYRFGNEGNIEGWDPVKYCLVFRYLARKYIDRDFMVMNLCLGSEQDIYEARKKHGYKSTLHLDWVEYLRLLKPCFEYAWAVGLSCYRDDDHNKLRPYKEMMLRLWAVEFNCDNYRDEERNVWWQWRMNQLAHGLNVQVFIPFAIGEPGCSHGAWPERYLLNDYEVDAWAKICLEKRSVLPF